jgi:hypothetical protein
MLEPLQPHPTLAGVSWRRGECVPWLPVRVDIYRGDAAALVAAELADPAHLPGAPSMNAGMVRVLPDGRPLKGRNHCSEDRQRAYTAGARRIVALKGGRFEVELRVAAEVAAPAMPNERRGQLRPLLRLVAGQSTSAHAAQGQRPALQLLKGGRC